MFLDGINEIIVFRICGKGWRKKLKGERIIGSREMRRWRSLRREKIIEWEKWEKIY